MSYAQVDGVDWRLVLADIYVCVNISIYFVCTRGMNINVCVNVSIPLKTYPVPGRDKTWWTIFNIMKFYHYIIFE